MTLERVLESEVMDTFEEARDYDAMDHSQVNTQFVTDLLASGALSANEATDGESDEEPIRVLDLGTGTAQIPVELCSGNPDCQVMAIDLSVHMLDLARYNIEAAGLIEQITLQHIDAKQMPLDSGLFDVVMSNSIVHHIPQPLDVLQQAIRVAAAGGYFFFRDLLRPEDEATVVELVQTYAGSEDVHQRQMFDDSLRAALSLEEIRELVEQLGFAGDTVQTTSDRHWTWQARKA